MNYLICTLLLLLGSVTYGQSVDEFIDQGIEHHDLGEFDKAVSSYKKALKIDAKNELANYEIALTYYSMKKYDEAIDHAGVAIKAEGDNQIAAYILKGSVLDITGKTDESIKLFKKAIKKTEGHYLLYYNLGLNYYKLGDYSNCEESIAGGIDLNPGHSSSHLVLGLLHDAQGHKVQSVLALYYFLLLEPDSERAKTAHETLMTNLGANVEEDPDKPNTINITLSSDGESEFMAAELMLSLLQASKSLEENEGKSDDEMFVENTDSFFNTMGELKSDNAKGIWWEFYTEFFYELAQTEHLPAFCKFITKGSNEDSAQWLEDNEEALDSMFSWLNADEEEETE